MSEEMSSQTYAALCLGDDRTGTWLWGTISKNARPNQTFYVDVINGFWQMKFDGVSRLATVCDTKQVVTGLRLAGFGKVPKSLMEDTGGNYNEIIAKFLRTGEYRRTEFYYDGE